MRFLNKVLRVLDDNFAQAAVLEADFIFFKRLKDSFGLSRVKEQTLLAFIFLKFFHLVRKQKLSQTFNHLQVL